MSNCSRLTQGWSINGITRFATGLPAGLGESGDYSLAGTAGIDGPNWLGGLGISDPRGVGADGKANRYFNKTAFSSEVLGSFGNANRRFFHGPGFNNWDLGLQKETKLLEGMSVQFRAEFFNAFNHAQFNNPNGNYSSSNMGVISSARAPRIGQVDMKILW